MRTGHEAPASSLLLLLGILSVGAFLLNWAPAMPQHSQLAQSALSVSCGKGDPTLNSQCSIDQDFSYECNYPAILRAGGKEIYCRKNAPCGGRFGDGHIVKGRCVKELCCHADSVDGKTLDGTFSDRPVFNETTGQWEGADTPLRLSAPNEDAASPLLYGIPNLLGPGSVFDEHGVVRPELPSIDTYPIQEYTAPPSMDTFFFGTEPPVPTEYRPLQPGHDEWFQTYGLESTASVPPNSADLTLGNESMRFIEYDVSGDAYYAGVFNPPGEMQDTPAADSAFQLSSGQGQGGPTGAGVSTFYHVETITEPLESAGDSPSRWPGLRSTLTDIYNGTLGRLFGRIE